MTEEAAAVKTGEEKAANSVGGKERLAFYFAALFRDMSYALAGGFLLLFYIDVMGFAGTAALLVIPIITRLWDGINDPLLGSYFDRRAYKKEKARPIFKNTALIVAIGLILMFFAPKFSKNTRIDYILKCVYAVLTYGIFEAFHTLNGTAFMTLYNSISANPDERTRVISISRLFSMAGSGIVYGGIPVLLGLFRNDDIAAKTYIYLGAACFVAVCFVAYNFLMYRFVKERVVAPAPEKQNFWDMIKRFAKNKLLILMIIGSVLANFINYSTIQLYFYTYNMGNPALRTAMYLCSAPAFILGALLVPKLVKKFDKRKLVIACALMMAAVNAVYLFAGYKPPLWAVVAVVLLTGLPENIKGILYWNMISDSVDYAEWKTGFRNDGLVYSIEGCASKIIGAVGAMFTGIVINAIDFVPNAVSQSEATMKGLFYIPQIVLIASALLTTIPYFFYDVDKKKYESILKELEERRARRKAEDAGT
jgi:sugar (Glycoside-Pentoside-Hexuronide) transporter